MKMFGECKEETFLVICRKETNWVLARHATFRRVHTNLFRFLKNGVFLSKTFKSSSKSASFESVHSVERFRIAPFSVMGNAGLSVDGDAKTCQKETVFSNENVLVWTEYPLLNTFFQ